MEKLEIRIFPMDEKELYNYMKINNIKLNIFNAKRKLIGCKKKRRNYDNL